MAIIDKERELVAVRIVYDGEASAGKTTNLYALSSSLSRKVLTPEQAGERTLYFDWLDYTGGLFEGMQIRCEVVSVPGQSMLSARRERLLRDADVVVLVVDASIASTTSVAERLSELRAELAPAAGIGPAILVQANKTDLCPGAEVATLRALCGKQKPLVGFLESIAVTGAGVRETFVLAVRLGLDRVRELRETGHLREGKADLDGHGLLRWMKLQEGHDGASAPDVPGHQASDEIKDLVRRVVAEASVDEARPTSRRRNHHAPPAAPDTSVSSGMIWPPVDGRIVLSQVVSDNVHLDRIEGAWSAVVQGRWRLHSPDEGEFEDVQDARAQLLRWARAHATLGSLLSSPRCIVVANTDVGSWRLWQLVKLRPSLRDLIASALRHTDVDLIADALVGAGELLVAMNDQRAGGQGVPPCSLDTVGEGERSAEFIGVFSEASPESARGDISSSEEVLKREFVSVVQDWQSISDELAGAMERCSEARGDSRAQLVASTLIRLMEA